jgi:hypothetical protein
MVLTQLLDLEGLDLRQTVTAIAISSSVPSVTTQLRRMAGRWFSSLPLTVAIVVWVFLVHLHIIPNPQSPIPNPQSPIPNPQSPIPNPQSPIPNPQFGQFRKFCLKV